MYKVLLVDDEPYVLEGLRDLVNWNKYGYVICGEASDGNQALQLLEELHPDLVITDVRMPCMNGLDFIEEVNKKRYSNVQFMILSGYEIFDYIKKAISLKVMAYLLKPIDVEELEEKLLTAKKIFDSKNNLNFNSKNYSMVFKQHSFTCVVYVEFPIFVCMEKLNDKIAQFYLKNTQNIQIQIEPFTDKEGRYLLLCSLEQEDKEFLQQYLESIYIGMKETFNIEIRMYVSTFLKGQDIEEQYKLAIRCFELLFYHTGENIYYWDKQKDDYHYEIDTNKSDWLTYKKQYPNKEKKDFIRDLFQYFKREKILPLIVRNTIFKLATQWKWKDIQWLKQINHMNYGSILNTVLVQCDKDQELEKLEIYSENRVENVLNYVLENYRENIKLKDLAKKFHFNKNYLGKALQQKTGMPLNSYLHFLRVEEAKKLLVKNELQILDIAQQLGYSDYDYFTSNFKKIEGMSPSAYKTARLEQVK